MPDATTGRPFEADNTGDRVEVDGMLSELDDHAVEQALQIKETCEGAESEVIALRVDQDKAADAVRKALQRGADSAAHVSDEGIAGSDVIATSLVLAEAI